MNVKTMLAVRRPGRWLAYTSDETGLRTGDGVVGIDVRISDGYAGGAHPVCESRVLAIDPETALPRW